MANALIGFSGFVGSLLMKQASFEMCYRSSNIGDIEGQSFDTVVCAGARAQKWIANREPEADLQNINGLIEHLKTVQCKNFILISTVDVFKNPIEVDEATPVDELGLHAYGLHRRLLEKFVESHFAEHLIVRLPGLVGPGLRKNVIFDFLNENNLDAIDSRGVFQFYPMVNLWYDIQIALAAGLKLIHLTAAPVSVADVSRLGFGKSFDHVLNHPPARYDLRTLHAPLFNRHGASAAPPGSQAPAWEPDACAGRFPHPDPLPKGEGDSECSLRDFHGNGSDFYQYSRSETIQAVRAYAQSEPRSLKSEPGVKA